VVSKLKLDLLSRSVQRIYRICSDVGGCCDSPHRSAIYFKTPFYGLNRRAMTSLLIHAIEVLGEQGVRADWQMHHEGRGAGLSHDSPLFHNGIRPLERPSRRHLPCNTLQIGQIPDCRKLPPFGDLIERELLRPNFATRRLNSPKDPIVRPCNSEMQM
jgi:hypothetical protein